MLTGLAIEGDTRLHRMAAGTKLAILLFAGLALYAVSNLALLAIAFLVAALLYVTTGLSINEGLRRLAPIVFTLVIFIAATGFFVSPMAAAESFFRLMSLVLLAGAITATTSTNDIMDVITRLAMPLDRLGLVHSADIGLAFALVLRFVPEIAERYSDIRDAHRARGLTLRPLSILAPLIILTLKDADTIAMAIDARGFRRTRDKVPAG